MKPPSSPQQDVAEDENLAWMLVIYDLIEQHNTESMSRQCIVIAKNIPVINDFAISASLSLSKLVKSTALACAYQWYTVTWEVAQEPMIGSEFLVNWTSFALQTDCGFLYVFIRGALPFVGKTGLSTSSENLTSKKSGNYSPHHRLRMLRGAAQQLWRCISLPPNIVWHRLHSFSARERHEAKLLQKGVIISDFRASIFLGFDFLL